MSSGGLGGEGSGCSGAVRVRSPVKCMHSGGLPHLGQGQENVCEMLLPTEFLGKVSKSRRKRREHATFCGRAMPFAIKRITPTYLSN